MDKPFCLICKKPRNTDPRAKYCCDKHRWRLVAARRGGVGPDPGATAGIAAGRSVGDPAARRSRTAADRDPAGPRRNGTGRRARISRRPPRRTVAPDALVPGRQAAPSPDVLSGAVGVARGSGPRHLRRGVYEPALRADQPIGGPRCSIAIAQADARLNRSDGDRTYRPRPRG